MNSVSQDDKSRWAPRAMLLAIAAPTIVGFVSAIAISPRSAPEWVIWILLELVAVTAAAVWLRGCIMRANEPLKAACLQLRDEQRVYLDASLAWILTPGTRAVFGDMVRGVQSRLDGLRRQHDDLSRSRELLETVLEHMVEGVVVLDQKSRIAFVNQSARKLLRLRDGDLASRPLYEVARHAELTRQIEAAIETRQPTIEEIDLPQQRMIVRSACIPMELGNDAGAVLVLYDVTELRKLERQRREFVSNVSHELKTPLTAIQNYADTLLDGALDDHANAARFVAGIQEQCERLEDMIQELLRLSRIESGQEVFTLREVALEQVVHESLDVHRPLAMGKSVALETSPPPTALSVWADQRALRTILDNLVNNAVKYTPADGRVIVAWQLEEGQARIDVIDSGVGIPSDQLPRVFERFYRVDRSRNRAVGGTGLGLAIVKHLVEELGGRVEAQSTLDQGSTFSIWLPVAVSDAGTAVDPVPLEAPANSWIDRD